MIARAFLAVLVATAAGAPAAAGPATRPTADVVWTGRTQPGPGPNVTRVLYLNRCTPDGCDLRPGDDDSRINTSSIAGAHVVIPAFTRSDETWNQVVACVRRTYAWFDIAVTDVDPGPGTQHFEVMFGGNSGSLANDWISVGAGGVSPGTCWVIPNSITFVFDVWGDNVEDLCYVAAQESAHSLGLDHELLATDPMTYLAYEGHRDFHDQWADCGEYQARGCWCGGDQQNSFRHIFDIFGPPPPTPPTVRITDPVADAVVAFGFTVAADYVDNLRVDRAELVLDGEVIASDVSPPLELHAGHIALHGVAPGPHQLGVRGYDPQGASDEDTIPIALAPPCASAAQCGAGLTCVGGECVAGPGTPGGLGERCSPAFECASGICGTNGVEQRCIEECVLGSYDCPDGFACRDTAHSVTGSCWPGEDPGGEYSYGSGGGCDAGGGGGSLMLVLGLLGAAIARVRPSTRSG